jgi:uncharacterized membrane protein YqjE
MNSDPTNPGEWLPSLRRISELFSALLRNRFEMFTVDLQEEKVRLLDLLIWLVVVAALGVAGIFLAVTALALWLWDALGYAGLLALAVTALAVASVMVGRMRRTLQTGPTPFAHTVAEFGKDCECLRRNH